MKILAKWFIVALAILATSYLLPQYVTVTSFSTALVVALLFGLINVFIRPVLIVLTLPINILSLGLFTFIVNGFCFWLVSFVKVDGFMLRGFWAAVLGAFAVSVISWVGDRVIGANED